MTSVAIKYVARGTEILEGRGGTQVLIIRPSNCTKKRATELTKMLAEAMNAELSSRAGDAKEGKE